jgi:hypothetical protein
MMFDASEWPDGEPVTCGRDLDLGWHIGIVAINGELFAFDSQTEETAEGPVLVTGFMMVVEKAQAPAERQRPSQAGFETVDGPMYKFSFGVAGVPDPGYDKSWENGLMAPPKARRLLQDHQPLRRRVSSHESLWTGDFDTSLRAAIEHLRSELRTASSRELREARMDPASDADYTPAERFSDELLFGAKRPSTGGQEGEQDLGESPV